MKVPSEQQRIRIRGARTHNLRGVDLDLPRERLTVFTGPSGSGKSSLAFDTIHAEGQRRYLETLRGDTRALFDQLQRPDVDLIEGLPPTLCVAQQAGSAQRRSTLATLTEIHDHLRLLWARLGTPHCLQCGRAVVKHSLAQIVRQVMALDEGCKVFLLAPIVRDRPGEHRDVFQSIRQGGFLRARLDGVLEEIRDIPKIDGKKKHTIEFVVDRLVIRSGIEERLRESLTAAVKHGSGQVIVTHADDGDWHDLRFSTRLACAECGLEFGTTSAGESEGNVSFGDLEPRFFSFNNPHGACPTCGGLGQVWQLDPSRLVPDRSMTLKQVADRLGEHLPEAVVVPMPESKVLSALVRMFPANISTGAAPAGESAWDPHGPLARWPEDAWQALLQGADSVWPGWLPELQRRSKEAEESDDAEVVQGIDALAGYLTCPDCGGARLEREVRAVRFEGKGLHEVTALTVDAAAEFFESFSHEPAAQARDLAGAANTLASAAGSESLAGAAGSDPRSVRGVLLQEIGHRLHFLQDVGLGYLTLDRPAPTLSGGEIQRARLATHLGGHLLGVCYVLDEPTIGLHPRDTQRLLGALRGLQRRGNTLIIVEHDEEVMRQADYLVDMGPGAGSLGGRLLACGTVEEVLANPESVTAPFLRGVCQEGGGDSVGPTSLSVGQTSLSVGQTSLSVGQTSLSVGQTSLSVGQTSLSVGQPSLSVGQTSLSVGQTSLSVGQTSLSVGGEAAFRGGGFAADRQECPSHQKTDRQECPSHPLPPKPPAAENLVIRGARHNNLKNVTVTIPLGRLVCITGVSGSGKSSLARDVLGNAVRRHLGLLAPEPGRHDGIDGLQHLDKIIEVDQAPLGRSTRSSPATYTGVYDEIRKVFAATRMAKVRGYKSNRFSFNVKGGRCEQCQGQGSRRVALQFLPELTVPCPQCRGKRFNQATLEVQFRGQSIAGVLDMPIAQALNLFENVPTVRRPLQALVDVGLGYLSLGQPSSTLSGGEAQRVKLARELARTSTGRTLYLLDEPTTGLHFADVANLLRVLGRLVEAGNTVVVIEHHLDLIAAADGVIDLGPEAGAAGGMLLAAGTPAQVAECPQSITGRFLRARWKVR